MVEIIQTPQIRRYIPSDYTAVKILLEELARLYEDNWNETHFQNHMQMRLLDTSIATFIAHAREHVCGCAFADLERDPRGMLFGRISNVNVVGDCQGKGVGSKLVDETIQFLSMMNVTSIWANINPNNKAMINMFEHREFEKWLKVMEKIIDPFSAPNQPEIQKEVKIRPLMEQDFPAIKRLIKALADIFNETFSEYWFDLTIQKFLQNPSSQIFIAEKAGQVAGVTFSEVRKDPTGNVYGYISNVMVDQDFRGQGIGSNLIEHASTFLQNLNMPKIWANVNHDNESMQKLFEHYGFKHKFTVMIKKLSFGGAC